jgi:predicted nucleotide-binding protein
MTEYRTYSNEDDEVVEFSVFIIHGLSEDWRIVEKYINEELHFKTSLLQDDNKFGETLIDRLEETIDFDCDCAVAIMTPDEKMANGDYRASQNVIFEIGYYQGVEDWDDVIILQNNSLKIQAEITGLTTIDYKTGEIESTFTRLKARLEDIYNDYCEIVD